MTPEQEKQVFIIYASIRLSGLLLFLVGVAIAFTNLVRPGSLPTLGAILAIVGTLYAVLAPPYYRRKMTKQVEEE